MKAFIKHGCLAIAAVAVFSAAVMFLWNMLVPDIFGLAVINFWQALGLLVLSRLLLGGFGGAHRMAGGLHAHRNPIREKWMKMTAEEQKEFIRKRHEFFHRRPFGKHGFWDEKDFAPETNDASKKE
ncbi:MAG: hypothetical protein LBR08_06405 [Bacteroidales bacterium]|jgi:hypothetical protein|nr:hypothetical protein [Bacteroidales bacterium]